MERVKIITIKQISNLTSAYELALDWRGNHDPEEYAEFDSWMNDIKDAIKAVKHDRIVLRKIIKDRQLFSDQLKLASTKLFNASDEVNNNGD